MLAVLTVFAATTPTPTGLATAAGRLVGTCLALWLLWSLSRSRVWRGLLLALFLVVVGSMAAITLLAPGARTAASPAPAPVSPRSSPRR